MSYMKNSKSSGGKFPVKLFIAILLAATALSSVFTIAQLDDEQVIVENISSYPSQYSAIIYWDTAILADSLVKYGTSPDNLSMNDYLGVHSYAHAAEITGLEPLTTYYFAVNSTNANGNSNESSVFNLTTTEDNVSPAYSNPNAEPSSGVIYSRNVSHVFSVFWNDNGIIANATILHDFAENGSFAEYPAEIENVSGRYSYRISGLRAGTYSWKMYAVDSSGNENETQMFTYQVNKSEQTAMLLLGGVQQNISIEQKSMLNISGILLNGEYFPGAMRLVVSNSTTIVNSTQAVIPANNSNESNNSIATISLMHYFDAAGIYNVTLYSNETENFTQGAWSFSVNVTPIEVNLFINKPEYGLGESVEYVVLAPNSSNLTIEVCGPFPQGSGFVECKTMITSLASNYPYMSVQQMTNKTGTYRIRSMIAYKGIVKSAEKNYTVINNMAVQITGDTTLKTGEFSSLVASATGGVGNLRYNWTLSNGTKISGQNLNVKYNIQGTYPVVLTVNDEAGNYKTETVTLTVKRYFVVKALVVDAADNSPIESAKVRMEDETKSTDDDGYAVFELFAGSYDMRVSTSGYSSYTATIESDANKTITIKLTELAENTNEPLDINLISPANNAAMNSPTVNFEAYVDLGGNTQATCMFYVAEDNNDWYRVMKTVSVKTTDRITHSEEFAGGKSFSWKVQCDTGSKSYASDIRKFAATSQDESDAELSIIGEDNQVIDAGEIRRRIELALANIDEMDMESKKDADALKFTDSVNKALRDYERAMRDISNIKYRKDLTTEEQDAKKLEYYNSLRSLETVIPLDVQNLGYETFISYPTSDDLQNLSKEYQQQRNIAGRANEEALADYQNGIIVTTRISNVEITYLGGKKEVITLIIKTIQVIDNSTDTFILESIPKGLAATSDELTMFSKEAKVINRDPLFKMDKQPQIVYYVTGEKSLELGRETKTILMSDTVFSTRNSMTGAVTFSDIDIDFTSPVSLVILIVIVSGAYLLYAFDVFGGMFEKSRRKWNSKRASKIIGLIRDASDMLSRGDTSRASLIFKEIQLVYEDSPDEVRAEVYEEASALLDSIDSAQLDTIIRTAENSAGNVSADEKQKIIESRRLLREAYGLLSDSLKEKYRERLEFTSKNILQKEADEI